VIKAAGLALLLLPMGGTTELFKISDPRIPESSGLAASHKHPGILYTHNDSGHLPQVFAIGPDGRTKATFTISGAQARDWEAISLGRDEQGRPALYIADIGDNLNGAWPYVTVYRVREPGRLRDQTLHATAFRFKYEDGPRNAESLLIDPRTNRLYVASKTKLFGGHGTLYEAPAHLKTGGYNILRKVGGAPATATDAAFAPDGSTFVIRGYFGATLYTAPGKELTDVDLPSQEQGESITYTADGRALLVGSEGDDQPVYRVPLPDEALPKSPSPSPSPGHNKAAPAASGTGHSRTLGYVIVAILAAGAAAWIVRRRTR
jgi:hypothetical protein